MTTLERFSNTAQLLFESLGYSITSSSTSVHTELEMMIVHITLNKDLPAGILEELTIAAQPLIRSMVAHQQNIDEDTVQISLDINNHLGILIEQLRIQARAYADRAMTFGVPIHMAPVTAFHRRIIHTFLQKTPGIKTESFGIGRDRHIVISVQD